ncbi:MAG: rhomboid family intramembrane serine protease [Fuerstiella sp.]
MRLLTSLAEQQSAMRLVAYLAVEGIQTTLEEDEGSWEIWVHQDDDREKSKTILEEFQQDPNHERYTKAERKVRNTLQEVDRIVANKQRMEERLKKRWSGSWWHCYPATYILIGLCILVVFVSSKPQAPRGMMLLPLCNKPKSVVVDKLHILPSGTPAGLAEGKDQRDVPIEFIYRLWPKQGADASTIFDFAVFRIKLTAKAVWNTLAAGEIWRPIGPAFLHFSLLHIVFNMMWLKSLGEAVEYERGTSKFLLLCLAIAVISNVAQLCWSGPNFGGMSGVVFGLIGYVWMKGKTQPQHGIGMTHQSITFAILWLVLCMTGTFGSIANGAHLIGFLTGIVIGARQAIYKKLPFIN